MNAYLEQQLKHQTRVCISAIPAYLWAEKGLDPSAGQYEMFAPGLEMKGSVWDQFGTPLPLGTLPDMTDVVSVEIDISRPDEPEVRITVGQGGDQVEVVFTLYDSGNESDAGLPMFDADIRVSNGDWAGFESMLKAAQWATVIWDRLGLSDRFPIVGKDE